MTREEAVNELNDRIKSAEYVDSDYIDCVSVDAVKMAISALSVLETNVGDTISRQAAIDAAVELAEARRRWETSEGQAQISGIDALMCAIEDLPSARHDLTEDCGKSDFYSAHEKSICF